MKIVILSDKFPPDSSGGAEVIAYSLANILVERGHEVYVVTTTTDDKNIGYTKEGNYTVHRIFSNYNMRWRAYKSLCNRKVVRELEKIIRQINPDIVHVHNIHMHLSYASLKISKKYSKAVFLTFHDVMAVHYGKLGARVDSSGKIIIDKINPLKHILQQKLRYNPVRNVIIKYYLKSVDKMFSVSIVIKDILEKEGISPIKVLYNGIDVSKWSIDEKKLIEFKQRYKLENKKVLFFGGRLSSAKGGLVAIEEVEKVI